MSDVDEIAAELFILTEAFRLVSQRARSAELSEDFIGLVECLEALVGRLLDAVSQRICDVPGPQNE